MSTLTGLSPRRMVSMLNARKKELFWAWIAYQTAKGLTTTSLIWVPLYLLWRSGG